jgi:serine/threonine protein kinase
MEKALASLQRASKAATLEAIQPWTMTSWEIEMGDPIEQSGSFGTVTKGVWLGHTKVAVKKLLIRLETAKLKSDFLKEVKTWYPLRHPHILPLLGACSTADIPFMVVPMMENGHALQFLKLYPNELDVRARILYEVSQGMQYLHSRHVIHGDLKAVNVLVCG